MIYIVFLYLVLAHYLLSFSLYMYVLYSFLVFVLGSLDISLFASWLFPLVLTFHCSVYRTCTREKKPHFYTHTLRACIISLKCGSAALGIINIRDNSQIRNDECYITDAYLYYLFTSDMIISNTL